MRLPERRLLNPARKTKLATDGVAANLAAGDRDGDGGGSSHLQA